MKYSQNEKILQVTEKTLVVGIDIASETHHARAFNYRGVEYGKLLKFNNDAQGFARFEEWIGRITKENSFEGVILAMEPTGHYWFNLDEHAKKKGMRTVLVNPHHVKKSKELDDNSPSKTDRKDPKTIALLVTAGRYMESYMPEGIYRDLRTLMTTRLRVSKEMSATANRVMRWLNLYFPEFTQVCRQWNGKAALEILKECPFPGELARKTVDEVVMMVWRGKKGKGVGAKKAAALIEAAKVSVGSRQGLMSARHELAMLLEDYESKVRHLEKTMVLIEAAASQVPHFHKLLEIKGIGLVTAAGFVAEVGDISRFSHPKQIQKLAGLNLKENSSGKQQGQTTISKRGRSRLRFYLTYAMMPVLSRNAEFRELHNYYTTRKNNPLKKRQSMVALSTKMIRIFYLILTKGVSYDPVKMMSDINRVETKVA